MAIETKPYIYFYGRCAEALAFYANVFDGKADIMHVKDTPPEVQKMMPPGSDDKVMHASFTGDGVAFFASDGAQEKVVDSEAGNIAVALNFDDAAKADRVLAALSDGGKVQWEFMPAFWGGRFGSVVDKFGTEWMMTAP